MNVLPLKKILCPIDYSEPSYAALQHAGELARSFDAELIVLHVVPSMSIEAEPGVYTMQNYDLERLDVSRQKLNQIIAERIPTGCKVQALVRSGNVAADEIVRAARQEGADLIVIATHGLTGWRHFVFGSVTERVLRLVRCPILIIHPPEK